MAQFWPLDHNLLTHWTRGKTDIQKIMRKFSKVAGYKINIQKLVAFLYTSNRKVIFKLLFIITKKFKYLRINLNKIFARPKETKILLFNLSHSQTNGFQNFDFQTPLYS